MKGKTNKKKNLKKKGIVHAHRFLEESEVGEFFFLIPTRFFRLGTHEKF